MQLIANSKAAGPSRVTIHKLQPRSVPETAGDHIAFLDPRGAGLDACRVSGSDPASHKAQLPELLTSGWTYAGAVSVAWVQEIAYLLSQPCSLARATKENFYVAVVEAPDGRTVLWTLSGIDSVSAVVGALAKAPDHAVVCTLDPADVMFLAIAIPFYGPGEVIGVRLGA